MILGIFLAIGESLSDLKSKGQLRRLVDWNIKYYLKTFDKVYIFSYKNEKMKLPKNCILISNRTGLHRYLYSLLLPILNQKNIKDCNVLRGLQITGGIPGITAKILYNKNCIVNYGYIYSKFAKIEGKYFQQMVFPTLSWLVQKFTHKIIITSKYLKKYVDPKKVIIIQNGVDVHLFKPHRKKNKNIVFVGRLVKQKNVSTIIESLKDLNEFKLIIAGDGPQRKNLENLSKIFKVNVKFLGVIEYNRLPKVYNMAQVFILSSLREGNPKSLLEAMACGCVPIGADVEGINNIIKNNYNGLLVETDPKSLKKAIIKLFNTPKLIENYSKKARQYIQKEHDIDKLLTKETQLLLNSSR